MLGISAILEIKLGTEGLQLMAEISELEDVELLESILTGIKTLDTSEQLRQIYHNVEAGVER
ncbi:MAG: hypothetical protein DSM107014_10870 [Gomphosphaeria aponina SAG 52.96 = DSM 107014]|uniref:Uncharacterized protein n=1 Tax=Gomphosphaeria aponina SAG 52.96 = DSM 107014 TaxID=1521640 RepID=A0A941GWY3_9CHRO|nr:hypothetical protein [Gomphosphaeria aponina SAG 52.96 = DSM 107014]